MNMDLYPQIGATASQWNLKSVHPQSYQHSDFPPLKPTGQPFRPLHIEQ